MLHAYMMVQSGIPMLYSGDEIGQVNDYTYKNDPEKRVDSRYIHRGKFDWKLADGRKKKERYKKNCLMELENLDPSEVRKKYLTHRQMSGRLIPGKMESLELCGNWRASR